MSVPLPGSSVSSPGMKLTPGLLWGTRLKLRPCSSILLAYVSYSDNIEFDFGPKDPEKKFKGLLSNFGEALNFPLTMPKGSLF
jgi:hypothetical protein